MARFKFTKLTKPEQDFYMAEAGFTDAEKDVFRLKCRGHSIIAISREAGISEAVVSVRTREIQDKMYRVGLECRKPEYSHIIRHLPCVVAANE